MLPVLASSPRIMEPIERPTRAPRPQPTSPAAMHLFVAVVVGAAFGGAIVAGLSGHGELAAYLTGLGVVTSIGWVAAAVERWTVTEDR